jgi:hypothetical protein
LCCIGLKHTLLYALLQVLPIAIRHYEDTVVVAACVSFLELCGLSAQLLQVDVAALNRITSYFKEQGYGVDSLSAGLQRLKSRKYEGFDYARSMSEHWSLVTSSCRGHQLPLSTTYLATIARYNDYVCFLSNIKCC